MQQPAPAIILSGGSEVVTIALIDALHQQKIPAVVIGLGRKSIVRNYAGVAHHEVIPWPPKSVDHTIASLLDALRHCPIRAPRPWPVFATEDGGLRLLASNPAVLRPSLAIPGARNLKDHGVDKAAAFAFLEQAGCADLLPRTVVIDSFGQARHAIAELGNDVVFKPSLKPYGMRIGGLQGKIITQSAPTESVDSVLGRLGGVWSIAERWVAQERLRPSPLGTTVWWGARFRDGRIRRILATEVRKFPNGGTGCWVKLGGDTEIDVPACRVVSALDVEGLAEVEMMHAKDGHLKLIEINTRAWLQIGLAEQARADLVHWAYRSLLGLSAPSEAGLILDRDGTWVSVERLLAAALSGQYGAPPMALAQATRVLAHCSYPAVYHTRDSNVIRRWLGRLAVRMLSRTER